MNKQHLEVPQFLVDETIKQLEQVDKSNLIAVIERCLSNPVSKPIIFEALQSVCPLSERLTLLSQLDLLGASKFLHNTHHTVASVAKDWDCFEEMCDLVDRIGDELQPYFNSAAKLITVYKQDYEHVFKLLELIVKKIKGMDKIKMRGVMSEEFSRYCWKDLKGEKRYDLTKQVFYYWYVVLKEAQMNQFPDVEKWTQVAAQYDTAGHLARFMKSDNSSTTDLAQILRKQRVAVFMQNPSLNTYEKALDSCTSDEEKKQTSDEIITGFETKIKSSDSKWLLLQLYAKTNRDTVSLCERLAPLTNLTSFDSWDSSHKLISKFYMLACETVIHTDPEYVIRTARTMLHIIFKTIPRIIMNQANSESKNFLDEIPNEKDDEDEYDDWYSEHSWGECDELDSEIVLDLKLWLQYAKLVCYPFVPRESYHKGYELKYTKNIPTLLPDGVQRFDQLIGECEQVFRQATDDKLMKHVMVLSLIWGGDIFRPLEAMYQSERKPKKHSADLIGLKSYVELFTREFYRLVTFCG